MAYKYGSFQQPRIGSGYQYGGGEPNYVNPDGIAAANARRNATYEAQRNLWAQNNANSMALRDQQAAYEWRQKADRENQRQRNVMGISPLSEQLVDPYSAAYESTYKDVGPTGEVSWKTADELGAGIQMSVGGTDGSAPAPLGMNPLSGRRMRREVRPEFAEAKEQLGVPSTRTISLDEYQQRKNIDANTTMAVKNYINGLAISRDKKQAMLNAYETKTKLEANDPLRTESIDNVTGDLVENVESVFSDPNPQPTPMPTPAPATGAGAGAGGEIQMDVTTDQMIKSDPTGSIVRGQDGRIYFLPKGTQDRIDITDRYKG